MLEIQIKQMLKQKRMSHKMYLFILLMLFVGNNKIYAQIEVYEGETIALSVVEEAGHTYTWEIYNDVEGINLAAIPGNSSETEAMFVDGNVGSTVSLTWFEPGVYFYKVTANNGCSNNLKLGQIIVNHALPTAEIEVIPDTICKGEYTTLYLAFTGNSPYNIKIEADNGIGDPVITAYNDINSNEYSIDVSPERNTTYRVIEITDQFGTNITSEVQVTISVKPIPSNSHIYQIN